MKTGIALATIAALALIGGLFVIAGPALASPYMGTEPDRMGGNSSDTMRSEIMGDKMMMWPDEPGKMFGAISSLQNEDDEPSWILTGHWMMSNETGGANTTGTNVTDFYAAFQMIELDGSAGHSHEIFNFTQDGESTTEGNSTTVTGTSTVSMREGPVEDVGTEITISEGKVIAISLDEEPLDDHFGDTPIYGIVITPEIMQHMMNNTMTSSMGDMDGTMGYMGGNETGTMENNETGTMTFDE